MDIAIFTEGTLTIHAAGVGVSRAEAVRQVLQNEASVKQFDQYVPHGNAIEKLSHWKAQGAVIYYLTSRQQPQEVAMVRTVLQRFAFPDHEHLLWRRNDETYQQLIEQLHPDLLIEDDCESIGGSPAMIYPNLPTQLQRDIVSIVVDEFGGIDMLPNSLMELFRVSCSMKNECDRT